MPPRLQNIHVDDVPTVTQLYTDPSSYQAPIQELEAHPDAVAEPNAFINSKVGLINADVTSMHIDAIVNAANNGLRGGGGIDGAIHARAGPELYDACEELPADSRGVRCPTGQAKITDSFDLPCGKIIHTPGPVWYAMTDKSEAERLLRSCYRSSLDVAIENGCRTIVFPPISTNIYGYPNAKAAEAALSEVRMWLEEKGKDVAIDKIVFTNVDKPDMDAYLHFIPKYFPPAPAAPTAHGAEDGKSSI
ncbi:RNA-directed RNA polymerase [Phyllosticta capitalensis]